MNKINKLVSVDQIMDLEPCYNRGQVEALWGKRKRLRLSEIAALDIPHEDRIWALVGLVDKRTRVRFALACALRVLPIFEKRYPADKRPRACCNTVARWLRGRATDEQVRAAADAAADAAASVSSTYAAGAAVAVASAYAATAASSFSASDAAASVSPTYAAGAASSASAAYAYAHVSPVDAADARRRERDAQIRWWVRALTSDR